MSVNTGLSHKGARRGERGNPTCAAAVDFWGEADVSVVLSLLHTAIGYKHGEASLGKGKEYDIWWISLMRWELDRADDKMASEYNLEGGATLHLVLALRGGC